jgi:hypothetical protein
MKKYARDNRPYLKPVTRIELSEKYSKLRIIAAVVLLSIGLLALTYGFTQLLSVQPGWQQVEVSSVEPNCSLDFVLMYDFSDSGGGATMQMRALSGVYTEATETGFRLFSAD